MNVTVTPTDEVLYVTPEREIQIEGELTDEQRARVLEIADKCPVHRTLHSQVLVTSKLV